jgi:hypothetical protein
MAGQQTLALAQQTETVLEMAVNLSEPGREPLLTHAINSISQGINSS